MEGTLSDLSTPNELDRTSVSENTSISKGEVRTGSGRGGHEVGPELVQVENRQDRGVE